MNLTKPQRQLLHRLDRLVPFPEPGTSKKPLDRLVSLGLVEYTKDSRYVKTRGVPGRVQTIYRARLTKAGSDFIFNGGIDH